MRGSGCMMINGCFLLEFTTPGLETVRTNTASYSGRKSSEPFSLCVVRFFFERTNFHIAKLFPEEASSEPCRLIRELQREAGYYSPLFRQDRRDNTAQMTDAIREFRIR